GNIGSMQRLLGTVLDSHASWLLLRGIKSLGIRMQRQTDSALAIARFLKDQTEIECVNYPYLEGSPHYELATKQMRGGGGVLSFQFKGGFEAATKFVDALQLIPVATSLGGVESVIEIPFTSIGARISSVPQHKIPESPLGLSACRWESKIWLTCWAIFAEGSKHCALKAIMPFVIHESAAGCPISRVLCESPVAYDGRFTTFFEFLRSSSKECETWRFTT